MCTETEVKVKLINESSRELPGEIMDKCIFSNTSELSEMAEEYNLRIKCFEKVFNDGVLVEQIITFGDIK